MLPTTNYPGSRAIITLVKVVAVLVALGGIAAGIIGGGNGGGSATVILGVLSGVAEGGVLLLLSCLADAVFDLADHASAQTAALQSQSRQLAKRADATSDGAQRRPQPQLDDLLARQP